MATTVTTHFTIQYDARIKLLYQQETALLANTMRTVRNVVGSQIRFPTLASMNMVQKARHGDVVGQNPVHATVTATLEDWYGPVYIDDLDTFKSNVDFQNAYVRDSVAAAVRKQQEIFITAATTGATSTSGGDTDGLHPVKVAEAIAVLDGNNVPQGDRWAAIGPREFQRLMAETSFASADFVEGPMFPNAPRVRHWNGINWRVVTDLQESASSTARYNLFYHREAIGMGIGKPITASIDWVPEKVAWLVNHRMSMGSVVIDPLGVVIVPTAATTGAIGST